MALTPPGIGAYVTDGRSLFEVERIGDGLARLRNCLMAIPPVPSELGQVTIGLRRLTTEFRVVRDAPPVPDHPDPTAS